MDQSEKTSVSTILENINNELNELGKNKQDINDEMNSLMQSLEEEKQKIDSDINALQLSINSISSEIATIVGQIEEVSKRNSKYIDNEMKNEAIAGFEQLIEDKKLMREELLNKIADLKNQIDGEENGVTANLDDLKKELESIESKEQMAKDRQEMYQKMHDKEIEERRQEKERFDLAKKQLNEEELKSKERNLITQFITEQGYDSDAFKDFMANPDDLEAIKNKYKSKFDQFVNDNTAQNSVNDKTNDNNTIVPIADVVKSKHDKAMDELASMGLYQSEEKEVSDVNDGSVVNFDLEKDDKADDGLNQEVMSDIEKIKSHIPDDILKPGATNTEPIDYTKVLDPGDIEKVEDLLSQDNKQEISAEDVEKPEDLLPPDNKQESPAELEPEMREKASVITQVKDKIKEVLDGPKAPVAIAALFAIGSAAIAVAGPIGAFTAAGTALSGVGSAGFVAGLGATGYEVTKSRNNK